MISWFEKHTKISLTITILIALTIFYLSSLSFEAGTPGPDFTLKPMIYHFFAFFFFNLFFIITIIQGKRRNEKFIPIITFIAMFYGLLDEFHQYFVPNRTSTLEDFLIDTAGILFATVFYRIRLRNNPKIRN